MPAKSRVFWTTQEKHTVLTAAHKLRQQQPRSTLKQVGTRAQGTLPKQRRRPVNNKLTSWLSAELKNDSQIAGQDSRAKNAGAMPAAAPPKPQAKAAKETPAGQRNVLQALIEQGAAILSGILSHPSVRNALGSGLKRNSDSRKR